MATHGVRSKTVRPVGRTYIMEDGTHRSWINGNNPRIHPRAIKEHPINRLRGFITLRVTNDVGLDTIMAANDR